MTTQVAATRAGKMADAIEASGSSVCVGLDPDLVQTPTEHVFEFNKRIIDDTHKLVAAYKPQLAFYEARGLDGLKALKRTVEYIRYKAPNVLVIGDAKRGDTDNTAKAYAAAMFEYWDFDATTVHLYQGTDSLAPFLEYPGKLVFVCCRTSNQSSVEIQDIKPAGTEDTVYMSVAKLSVEAANDRPGDVGLVVGATFPYELEKLRDRFPETPFLIPGVGAQGGSATEAALLARDNFLINSSRGVIYASSSGSGGSGPKRAVEDIRRQISLAC